MAPPITWRNVNAPAAPNLAGELLASQRAGADLGRSIRNLGTDVQDFADTKQKRETDEFITYLNSLGTDQERNQAALDANKAFLDLGRANEAVTSAQNQDLVVARFDQSIADAKLRNEQTKQNININQGNFDNTQNLFERNENKYNAEETTRKLKNTLRNLNLEDEINDFPEEQILSDKQRDLANRKAAEESANLDQKEKNRTDKINLRKALNIFRKGTGTGTTDLDRDAASLANIYNDAIDNGTSPENMKLFIGVQNRLLNRYEADTNKYILDIANYYSEESEESPVDNVNAIPSEAYTPQLRQDLENIITQDLQNKFPWMTEPQLREIAKREINKNIGANANFAAEAQKRDLANKIAANTAEGVRKRNVQDAIDTTKMHRYPGIHITEETMKRLSESGTEFNEHNQGKLRKSVNVVIQRLRSALPGLTETGIQQLNLGILDLFRQVIYNKDRLGFNDAVDDFVLFPIDPETDISELSTPVLLQEIQKSFSQHKGSNKTHEGLRKAIDKVLNRPASKPKDSDKGLLENAVQKFPFLLGGNNDHKNAVQKFPSLFGDINNVRKNAVPQLIGHTEAGKLILQDQPIPALDLKGKTLEEIVQRFSNPLVDSNKKLEETVQRSPSYLGNIVKNVMRELVGPAEAEELMKGKTLEEIAAIVESLVNPK